MKPETTEELQQRIGQALDQAAEQLDAATLERLRRARQQALRQTTDAGPEYSGRSWWRWFPGWLRFDPLPLAGVGALVGVALLGWWLTSWHQAPVPAWSPGPDGMEMLVTGADLELYRQLDFYLWLEQERVREEGAPGDST